MTAERLAKVVVGTDLDGLHCIVKGAVTSNKYNLSEWVLLLERCSQFQTANFRQVKIYESQDKSFLSRDSKGITRMGANDRLISAGG